MFNPNPDLRLAKTILYLEKIWKLISQEDVDEDAIDEYVEELRKDPFNEDSENISILLQLGLYDKAMPAIKSFIREHARSLFVKLFDSTIVKKYKL